jgi:hypothetical protein
MHATVVELEEYSEETLWGPFDIGSEEEKRFIELMKSIPEEIKDAYFEIEKDLEKAYAKLAGDIQLLVMRIYHGTPLEGKCQLCPRIRTTNTRKRKEKKVVELEQRY